jgi:formylglycine-generating enzyme required for sulfatase activity
MQRIEGGKFRMGCVETRDGTCSTDEQPDHEVSISAFHLSKYEVTNGEFVQFLNAISPQISFDANADNISYGGKVIFGLFCGTKKGDCSGFKEQIEYSAADRPGGRFSVVAGFEKHPAVMVSKYGADAYCAWLSTKTGKTYRLPSEAEWEFAARGGTQSQRYKYAGANDLNAFGWYNSNSSSASHPVGLKKANELGLYDLSGNVWEWCADWYDAAYYKNSPSVNPKGPTSGAKSVLRGGSWDYDDGYSRVAFRYNYNPDNTNVKFGFRVARNL